MLDALDISCDSLTPRGVSGLKYCVIIITASGMWSHPPRGEWIEILILADIERNHPGLTPRGVSGLKSIKKKWYEMITLSHPPRGEWIEIYPIARLSNAFSSHPPRGEWIEIRSN